jgi:hypothetical protein
MAVITDRVVRECLGSPFDKFFFLPADGTRGGILLAWQSALVLISHPHFTTNALIARISIGGSELVVYRRLWSPE